MIWDSSDSTLDEHQVDCAVRAVIMRHEFLRCFAVGDSSSIQTCRRQFVSDSVNVRWLPNHHDRASMLSNCALPVDPFAEQAEFVCAKAKSGGFLVAIRASHLFIDGFGSTVLCRELQAEIAGAASRDVWTITRALEAQSSPAGQRRHTEAVQHMASVARSVSQGTHVQSSQNIGKRIRWYTANSDGAEVSQITVVNKCLEQLDEFQFGEVLVTPGIYRSPIAAYVGLTTQPGLVEVSSHTRSRRNALLTARRHAYYDPRAADVVELRSRLSSGCGLNVHEIGPEYFEKSSRLEPGQTDAKLPSHLDAIIDAAVSGAQTRWTVTARSDRVEELARRYESLSRNEES